MSWKLGLQKIPLSAAVQPATDGISPARVYSLRPNAGKGWGEKTAIPQKHPLLVSRLPEERGNARCAASLVGLQV